jgi:hypothetical protein
MAANRLGRHSVWILEDAWFELGPCAQPYRLILEDARLPADNVVKDQRNIEDGRTCRNCGHSLGFNGRRVVGEE